METNARSVDGSSAIESSAVALISATDHASDAGTDAKPIASSVGGPVATCSASSASSTHGADACTGAFPTSSARLRIAMLAPCPFPSHQGTQVFLRHLANALVDDGHTLSLFTYALAERLEGAFVDRRVELVRAGGGGVGTRSGPSWGRVVGDGALLRRAWAELRRERPDVLHVHNAEGLVLGSLLKRTLEVPLVFHAHNVLGHELPLYATRPAAKRIARAAAAAFDHALPRLADAVICFDERQADHYASLGVAPPRLHVVPLGLDHDELRAHTGTTIPDASSYLTPDPVAPLVVYAGNPDAYQNPELIRASFAALRQKLPGARLRIISNHSTEAFGRLASEPRVHFCSFSGPAQLARLIAEADVGLCARTLWTGAPVKILSYVSAGVPVVACGEGAAMLADFPEAGLLTAAEPDALARGLHEVIAHRSAFDVSRMRQATSIQAHARAYREVYASVCR